MNWPPYDPSISGLVALLLMLAVMFGVFWLFTRKQRRAYDDNLYANYKDNTVPVDPTLKTAYRKRCVRVAVATILLGVAPLNGLTFLAAHAYDPEPRGTTSIEAARLFGLESGKPYALNLGGRTGGNTGTVSLGGNSAQRYSLPQWDVTTGSSVTIGLKHFNGDDAPYDLPLKKISRFHESTTEQPSITFFFVETGGYYGTTIDTVSPSCTPVIRLAVVMCDRTITSVPQLDEKVRKAGPGMFLTEADMIHHVEIVGTPAMHAQIMGTSG